MDYIFKDIKPLLKKSKSFLDVELLGKSEKDIPIYKLQFGTGTKKILIWSQMHGNESTGTKAVFDFLNCLDEYKEDAIAQSILNNCTIIIVPMLNPDGAQNYTRVNAHQY